MLIWLSVASAFSSFVTIMLAESGTFGVMASAAFFGLTSFPIYSVSAAHAHDFATDDQRVELSAALMFFYAIGAIAAPLVAAVLISQFGPSSLFVLLAAAHIALVVYSVWRMRARTSPTDRTRYVWSPRTSFLIGRLTGKHRNNR